MSWDKRFNTCQTCHKHRKRYAKTSMGISIPICTGCNRAEILCSC